MTADHGNSEHMIEPDGSPNTAHTSNPVPLWIDRPGLSLREGGALGDVAPDPLRADGLGPRSGDGWHAAASWVEIARVRDHPRRTGGPRRMDRALIARTAPPFGAAVSVSGASTSPPA